MVHLTSDTHDADPATCARSRWSRCQNHEIETLQSARTSVLRRGLCLSRDLQACRVPAKKETEVTEALMEDRILSLHRLFVSNLKVALHAL